MIEGACLCGAVRWTFAGEPDGALACNCTACRRYGVLWAYGYLDEAVQTSGVTRAYTRPLDADRVHLAFHFCPDCGCLAFWQALKPNEQGQSRIAVNLRLASPGAVANVPVTRFDGLETWSKLPHDGRCVSDYWF